MARYTLNFAGISPLLTHNPLSMAAPKTASKGSKIPEPEVEAEAGVYRTEDGVCAIPGIGFRSGMVKAAGAWKVPRGKGFMSSRIAHIMVVEELVELIDPETSEPLTSYRIDARRAVVQRQGITRCRPRFDKWSGTFTIEYDDKLVDPDIFVEIAADAGSRIGVGDYRPEKKGWFGRYSITQ